MGGSPSKCRAVGITPVLIWRDGETLMNLRLASLTAITAAAFAAPAVAHHSFAMFDADKTVTVQGTVTEFEWLKTPHFTRHPGGALPRPRRSASFLRHVRRRQDGHRARHGDRIRVGQSAFL